VKPEEPSVTEAARNFAECANRARDQDVTFVLLNNGTPVAELTPTRERFAPPASLLPFWPKTG
jgi:hypothetical protein